MYKKFHNETIATLTVFILGSLMILWPWKIGVPRLDAQGNEIIKGGKKLIEGYEMFIPDFSTEVLWATLIVLADADK